MPYDFFLSYASQDNELRLPGRLDSAWVTTFHDVLVPQLQYHLGRKVSVFFDRRDLSGNSALTPEIEAALDNSHLFVAVSSPTYYERPWCKLERQRFIKRLGLNPVAAKRVFIIHTTEILQQIWQGEFFRDLRGYSFFRQSKDGSLLTLGSPALDVEIADNNSYYAEIFGLAQAMNSRIRELEGNAAQEPAAAIPVPSEIDAVFLAENSICAHAEREEVRAALRDAGFEVRPASSLMGKPAAELDAAMSSALAFVQIVGPELLELPGEEETAYDYVQLGAARAAGLTTFRWRPPDLKLGAGAPSFPGYRDYATASDVREQLLPTFKTDLVNTLKDLRAERRLRQAAHGEERLVLITGEPPDLKSHGDKVTRQLQEHALGYYITNSPAAEIHANDVRGFLVLYGNGKAETVRDWLALVRKLPKTRQNALRVGVYFCDPPPEIDGRPLLYYTPSIQKIRWDDQPSLDAFARAIAQ